VWEFGDVEGDVVQSVDGVFGCVVDVRGQKAIRRRAEGEE
jgi:hypothetical protein